MLMLVHYFNITLCYADIILLSCIKFISLHSITLIELHYTSVMLHYIMLHYANVITVHYTNVIMFYYDTFYYAVCPHT